MSTSRFLFSALVLAASFASAQVEVEVVLPEETYHPQVGMPVDYTFSAGSYYEPNPPWVPPVKQITRRFEFELIEARVGAQTLAISGPDREIAVERDTGRLHWIPRQLDQGPVVIRVRATVYSRSYTVINGNLVQIVWTSVGTGEGTADIDGASTALDRHSIHSLVAPHSGDVVRPEALPVRGLIRADPLYDVVEWELAWAYDLSTPTWNPIATGTGDVLPTAPEADWVALAPVLGTWDASSLATGSYRLRLRVVLDGPDGLDEDVTELELRVDSRLKEGFPIATGGLLRAPMAVDLDDDGRDELIAVDRWGMLRVWDAAGALVADPVWIGATDAQVTVGNVADGPEPEIVVAAGSHAHQALVGFRLVPARQAQRIPYELTQVFGQTLPVGLVLKAPVTLTNFDGDGRLEIIAPLSSVAEGVDARVSAYRVVSGELATIFHAPLVGRTDLLCAPSVAHLGENPPNIIAVAPARVFGLTRTGEAMAGWGPYGQPARLGGSPGRVSVAKPAIADLDGQGLPEVVVGGGVYSAQGSQLYPVFQNGIQRDLSPAIGDIDGDGLLDIVVGQRGLTGSGTNFGHDLGQSHLWPKHHVGFGGSALAHVGNGPGDAIWTPAHGALYRADPADADTPDYNPHYILIGNDVGTLERSPRAAVVPTIGDFDADGLADLAVGVDHPLYGGQLFVYELGESYQAETSPWRMAGHDPQRTGCYRPPEPNRPPALTATVVGTDVHLSWTDASAVETGYLVERSPTGEAFSFVTIGTLGAGATQLYDSPGSGTWTYRVKALRALPDGSTLRSQPSPFASATLP